MAFRTCTVATLLVLSLHFAPGAAEKPALQSRPGIGGADVVFMYSARDAAQYDQYAGTVVGWGGRARSRDSRAVEGWRNRVAAAHKRGMRYCGSVDFLVDFRGFMDFRPDTFMDATCRDLDGNPIRVPWLMDHEYKGRPAWWWCTNNPDYQAFLRDQAERACLAPIDGLHIDDYSGTSHCSSYAGGCFCSHCMKGFAAYLGGRFSDDRLKEMGIEDAARFNYRDYLKAGGVTTQVYRRQRREVPLIDVFQGYQNSRMKVRVREIFEYAERLRGRPLVRSVNSGVGSPRTVLPAPLIDYFCGEVSHRASSKVPSTGPVFVYRLVEALGRRQTATASGGDWAWIKANEKPGLVRTWIAQAYANGSVFMVPHRQWCHTPELGTHWWNGKPEDFAYLYRFVREHASLLEGYRPSAPVALLYTQQNFYAVRSAAVALAEANVPYAIVPADDLGLPAGLEEVSAETYDYLIKARGESAPKLPRSPEDSKGKILTWKGLAGLPDKVLNRVEVEGSDRVRVSVRHKPGDPAAPIVCHVLNQDYNFERDDVDPADVQVTIDCGRSAESGRGGSIRSATIHEPEKESRPLGIQTIDTRVSFEVKNLGLWAIVELKTGVRSAGFSP